MKSDLIDFFKEYRIQTGDFVKEYQILDHANRIYLVIKMDVTVQLKPTDCFG